MNRAAEQLTEPLLLVKESSGAELINAVDAVLQGRTYLTSALPTHRPPWTCRVVGRW